jgi:hypothetical protein
VTPKLSIPIVARNEEARQPDCLPSVALAGRVRCVVATSRFAWHQVPFDNSVGDRRRRHGWAGSVGTTSIPRLFQRGAKRWRVQRVHPGLDWVGKQGQPIKTGALVHLVDRDVSDMPRRLDKYSSAKAAELIPFGDIGTLRANLCRFVSRAFPLLSCLKARLEPERHGGQKP